MTAPSKFALDPNSADYALDPQPDPGHFHSTSGLHQASGALTPLSNPSSGTAFQPDTTSDREVQAGTTTAGSVVVALSPDGVTYTNVQARTLQATDCVVQYVPKGWHIKITLTTSTFVSNETFAI